MRLIILFLPILGLLLGCDKPNPAPETMDPIYSDLEKEAKNAESAAKSAEKELEGFQKDMDAIVPQTGQIKYAQKRVYETQAKIEKARQMQLYWETRMESRKQWDHDHYLQAYKDKKPWPPPEEWEDYKMQRKLEMAPRNWNIKERLDQAKLGISLKSGEGGEGKTENKGEGHEAAPPHEEH